MNAPFEFTRQATEDHDGLWWFIARDNGLVLLPVVYRLP
jgi:hypothetical protein